MKQATIPVKSTSKLNVYVTADLSVEGADVNLLQVIARDSESLKVVEKGDLLEIRADSDCRLIVPATMIVTIQKCDGDVHITNLKSRVILGKVSGDLTMSAVAGASVETVDGDVSMSAITGETELARIGGDLIADRTTSLVCGAVGGDARVLNLDGQLNVRTGGDAEVSTFLEKMPHISVLAGGDATLIVSPQANANLVIHSGGEDIVVKACGQEVNLQEGELNLPLGEGGEEVRIEAGGDVVVSDSQIPQDDYRNIFDDMQSSWNDFGINLEMNLKNGIHLTTDSINLAMDHAVRATDKAQEKMEKAGKQLEEKMRKLEKKGKWVGVSFDDPVPLKEKKSSGATDEERMLILKMLQEKKISIEEAEKLLSALE